MAVTIIDVARYAGVSKSTVSAVLCGKPGVKESTRQRVLDAVAELKYIPNYNARCFVRRKTNILGALILSDQRPRDDYAFDAETGVYAQDVIAGMIEALIHTDFGLITEYWDPCSPELPISVRDNRVDGLFLIGAAKVGDPLVQLLQERGTPIVAIGRLYDSIDSIRVNIAQSAYLATTALLSAGCRRIGFINCPSRYSSSEERRTGFQQAIEEYGLSPEQAPLVFSHANTGTDGYAAIDALVSAHGLPEGIIASNVSITMGVMRWLYEHHLRVPDDICLIGHEDSLLYGYSAPPLTAIDIKKTQTGASAIDLMLARLNGDLTDTAVQKVIVPTINDRGSIILRG